MPIRFSMLAFLYCQLASGLLLSQDSNEPKSIAKRPPVEARLIVKQSKYFLPEDRLGEAFRKRIVEELESDNLPPPPRVALVLELRNVSDDDVMIGPRGSVTEPDLMVEGEGVVEPENLRSFSGRSSGTSVQPTIKPGETHRIRITSLNPQGGTPCFFWNQPGEYSITATCIVYTGLPPFPFVDGKKPTGQRKQYEVTTPPVKVQVVLENQQRENRRRPLVVAHRGLLHHAPENTLANFRACLELRLGFEFDVQKTNDGGLVCIHDDSVNRTTNGVGHVSELSLRGLRKLDAGRWFHRRFAGEKVPTIDEVFQLIAEYRQHDFLVAVDLKAEDVAHDVVRLAEKHQVLNRLLFIGSTISEPGVREELKAASRQAQTAVVANNLAEFPGALKAADGDWVYFRYLPTKEQMAAVHQAGKRAFIAGSTVSGKLKQNWQQAANAGIDAVLTDYPLDLSTMLRQNATAE